MAKFSAQVDKIVLATKKRQLALMRQSLQETVDVAQTPVAKGGRMRVDTGFLRASGQSSLNGMPTGPQRGAEGGAYNWKENQTELTLAGMDLGSTFFFGWTANYAKYREAFDGFLETAVQGWPQRVERIGREIVRRISARG
jgi:hypothetical protein